MTTSNTEIHTADELRERQVRAIMKAVAELYARFGPQGFSPEVIFEGATKGAAVGLLDSTAVAAKDVGEMFEDMGKSFAELDKPILRVVQ